MKKIYKINSNIFFTNLRTFFYLKIISKFLLLEYDDVRMSNGIRPGRPGNNFGIGRSLKFLVLSFPN